MSDKHLTTALILNASILLIPSNFKFVPIVILVYLVFKNFRRIDLTYLVFMSIPYLIIVLGVFHSTNLERAFAQIQTGVSLLLYPLCFSMIPKNVLNKIEIRKITSAFIVSIFIFSAIVFLYYLFIKGESLMFLTQHYITLIDKIIYNKYQIHSIYLTLLLTISIIFSLKKLIKTKNIFFSLYLINIIYCLFLLAIMNKRASIILIIVTSIFFVFTLNKKIKKVAVISTFAAIVLLISLVVFLPRFNGNNFVEFKKIEQTINDPKTSIGTRVILNKAAFEIFKNNPFIGVGTGDDRLILARVTSKLSDGVVENYNSHNQFSSYLIKTGFFGLSMFLFYCFFLSKLALKSKNIVFICLMAIFFGNMLIENILEREAGVLVFSFFVSYYSRLYYRNEKK